MSNTRASPGHPLGPKRFGTPPIDEKTPVPALAEEHVVQFYEDDPSLAREATEFLAAGLKGPDTVIVIATAPHREALRQRLDSLGIETSTALREGRLTFLDAHQTLAVFMRDGVPVRELFQSVVGRLVASKANQLNPPARLRAYGEMIDVLWREGQRTAAIRLEELWNDLQSTHRFTLLCAYAMASFLKQPALLRGGCATQTRVVEGSSSESGARAIELPSPSVIPFQYTRRLEQEIARRGEVESSLRTALRELRAKEEDLRASEELFRDFVESAPLGLHRLGPDGTILWANRAELELLGYESHEYVGRPFSDFHVDPEVIADILDRVARGEVLHDYESRLRAKDGGIKHVLLGANACVHGGCLVHTRCFMRDITQRREAELAHQQSHRQLELITDALPVLVAFVDTDLCYRFVSGAYERWFGYPKNQVVGRHLRDVLGHDAFQEIRPHVERALTGEVATFEAKVPYRDGGIRWIEATYLPQRGALPQQSQANQVIGFVALVRDVSQQRSFERFRAAAAARAERLLTITEAIAAAVSPDDVFGALVDRVSDSLGASSAGLWLLDDQTGHARLMRSRGYSASTRESIETLFPDRPPLIPATECLRTREPVWISSQAAMLNRYPHLASVATPGRSYRVACLPLIANGRLLGTLGITIEEAGEETEDDREFLLLVALYAAQALERLRLLDAETRSRANADAAALHLGILSRASRAFAESNLDFESRLRGIVAELASSLDSCIHISLLEPDGLVHLRAVLHPDPKAQEILTQLAPTAPLNPGEGVTGMIAATGESVLLPLINQSDVASRAPEPYRAFLQQYPVYALMGAALRVQGRVVGAAIATRCRPGETYRAKDLRLLEELAERAALAIENSRLYEESLQGRKRAEQLYRFAQSVVAAERVEEVFDAALAAIQNALGARRSSVLTYDEEGILRFRAWRGLSESYRSAVEGHSPWTREAIAPQPILVSDAKQDPKMAAYLPALQKEGIGALAFFPLVTRGRLLGKFMVYYERPHLFAESEVETARAIANHLASVIARFGAIAKLEDTVHQNELFAGVLAHDLRNPLGAMTTAAQLLLRRLEGENSLGEREAKPLSRILSSGQRMTTMIEQLLDFTRIRSGGGIPIEPRETMLAELCGQVISELEVTHPGWRIRCAATGDQSGRWDSDRLLQLFSNLIANACQHGAPESPVLVVLDGKAERTVRIEVQNRGAIAESLLPHLFDPFRSTGHRRDQSRGLGLGLFIVREIVRGHGGTIEVTSSEASGTHFVIQLPRQAERKNENPLRTP